MSTKPETNLESLSRYYLAAAHLTKAEVALIDCMAVSPAYSDLHDAKHKLSVVRHEFNKQIVALQNPPGK